MASAEDYSSNYVLSNRGETWITLFFAPYYHRATAFPQVGSCFGPRQGRESDDSVQVLFLADRSLLISFTGKSLRISCN